jgi:hypothetical protein
MSDPVGLSNCILWLDAADTSTLTLNGRRVSEWRSKGLSNISFRPGAQPFPQTIGAPLYVPSSRAVYFDNGDYQAGQTYPDSAALQMSNVSVSWPDPAIKTIYIVVNVLNGTTTSFNNAFVMNGTGYNSALYVTGPGNTSYQFFDFTYNGYGSPAPGARLTYGTNFKPYTTTIATYRTDFLVLDREDIHFNGTLINSSPISIAPLGSTTITRIALGGGGNLYTGYIHELLYYSDYHTEQQRQQVEAYLTAKWKPNITLKTYFPLYQYIPLSSNIYVNAEGKGPTYLFIQPTDLPVGLTFNPLTQTISGKSVRTGTETTTVYAVDDVGTTTLDLTFQTDFPVVKRTFGSAANYTSYVRQYTTANAAQNARDRFVLTEDVGLGAFTAPYPPDVITQTVDPKCFVGPSSNCQGTIL